MATRKRIKRRKVEPKEEVKKVKPSTKKEKPVEKEKPVKEESKPEVKGDLPVIEEPKPAVVEEKGETSEPKPEIKEEVKVEEPVIEGGVEPESEEVSEIEEPVIEEKHEIKELESVGDACEESATEEVIVEEVVVNEEVKVDEPEIVEPITVEDELVLEDDSNEGNTKEIEKLQERQAEIESLEEELRQKEYNLHIKEQEFNGLEASEGSKVECDEKYEGDVEEDNGLEVPEFGENKPEKSVLNVSEGTNTSDDKNLLEGDFGALNDTNILGVQDEVVEEELQYEATEDFGDSEEGIGFSLDDIRVKPSDGLNYDEGIFTDVVEVAEIEPDLEELTLEEPNLDDGDLIDEPQPKLSMAQRELLRQVVDISKEDIVEDDYKLEVENQVSEEERLLSSIAGDLSDVLPIKEGKRLESEINAKADILRKKMKEKVRSEQKEQDKLDRESMELRAEFAQMTEKKKSKRRGLFGRKKGG